MQVLQSIPNLPLSYPVKIVVEGEKINFWERVGLLYQHLVEIAHFN